MEFKGTKGKFEVIEHSWSDTSIMCGNKEIATKNIYDEATEENQEELELEVSANFKLLSKAPEMLEMLKKCREYFLLKTDLKSEERAEAIGELIESATTI